MLNQGVLEESFGPSSKVLSLAVMSRPYNQLKNEKAVKITLDGKECVLEEGKHYRALV